MTEQSIPATNPRRSRKTKHEAQPSSPPAKQPSKKDQVLGLLARPDGATLSEIMHATGWLPHTSRAALTGLRKAGHVIAKGKRGEITCYSIAAVAS